MPNCIDDRIDSVCDHEVVAQARERNHRMAFFAIEGPLPHERESRHVIATALALAAGVDATSLRVSADTASLSLSYDAKLVSVARIRETMNQGLAPRGLSVSTLLADPPG